MKKMFLIFILLIGSVFAQTEVTKSKMPTLVRLGDNVIVTPLVYYSPADSLTYYVVFNSSGFLVVDIDSSKLLDSVQVNIEELNGLAQSIETNTDTIEANVIEGNGLLQQLDNNSDGLEGLVDSVQANVEETNYLAQANRLLITALKDTSKSQNDRILDYINSLELYLSAFKDTSKAHSDRMLNYINGLETLESALKDTNKAQTDRILDYINNLETYASASKDTNKSQLDRVLDYINSIEGLSSALKDTSKSQLDRGLDYFSSIKSNTSAGKDTAKSQLDRVLDYINGLEGNGSALKDTNKSQLDRLLNYINGLEASSDSNEVNQEEANTLIQALRTYYANIYAAGGGGKNYIQVRLVDGTNEGSLSGSGDLEVSGDAGVALATKAGSDSIEVNIEENNTLAQANRALLTLANDSSKVGRDDIRIIKGQTDVDTTFNGSKRSKMFLQHDVFTDTLKIDTLYSVTGIVDLGNYSLVGIHTPEYWTAAPITFLVSTDGTNFHTLYYQDVEWSMVCSADKFLSVNLNAFYGFRYLKIRSGTKDTPVAQGNRTFTVIAKLL